MPDAKRRRSLAGTEPVRHRLRARREAHSLRVIIHEPEPDEQIEGRGKSKTYVHHRAHQQPGRHEVARVGMVAEKSIEEFRYPVNYTTDGDDDSQAFLGIFKVIAHGLERHIDVGAHEVIERVSDDGRGENAP